MSLRRFLFCFCSIFLASALIFFSESAGYSWASQRVLFRILVTFSSLHFHSSHHFSVSLFFSFWSFHVLGEFLLRNEKRRKRRRRMHRHTHTHKRVESHESKQASIHTFLEKHPLPTQILGIHIQSHRALLHSFTNKRIDIFCKWEM